jgi:hypothetical protein
MTIDGTPILLTGLRTALEAFSFAPERDQPIGKATVKSHAARANARPRVRCNPPTDRQDGHISQVRKPDGTDAIQIHRARCSVLPTPSIVPGLCGPGAVETSMQSSPATLVQTRAEGIYARVAAASSTLFLQKTRARGEGVGGLSLGIALRRGRGQNSRSSRRAGLSTSLSTIFCFSKNLAARI